MKRMLDLPVMPGYFLKFLRQHVQNDDVLNKFIEGLPGRVPIGVNHRNFTSGKVTRVVPDSTFSCLRGQCELDLRSIENVTLRGRLEEAPMSVPTSLGLQFRFNENDMELPPSSEGGAIQWLQRLFDSHPDLLITEIIPTELSILDGRAAAAPLHGSRVLLNFEATQDGVKLEVENQIRGRGKIVQRSMSNEEEQVDVEEQDVEMDEAEEADEAEEVEEEVEEEPPAKSKKRPAPKAKVAPAPIKKKAKIASGKAQEAEEQAEEEDEEAEEDAEEAAEEEKKKKKIVVTKKVVKPPVKKAATAPAKKPATPPAKKPTTPPATPTKKAAPSTPPTKKPLTANERERQKIERDVAKTKNADEAVAKFKDRVIRMTSVHKDIMGNLDRLNELEMLDDDEAETVGRFVSEKPLDYVPADRDEKQLIEGVAFVGRNYNRLRDSFYAKFREEQENETVERKKVQPSKVNGVKPTASKKTAEPPADDVDDDEEDGAIWAENPLSGVAAMGEKWVDSMNKQLNKSKKPIKKAASK